MQVTHVQIPMPVPAAGPTRANPDADRGVEELLLSPRPEKPEELNWFYRYGTLPTIAGTIAVSTGATVGASFASGGLIGRCLGLTAGSVIGGTVGFVVGDHLVSRLSGGPPSRRALLIGRGTALALFLGLGWALSGTRLPNDFVLGPGVPALFLSLFGGIELSMRAIYPVQMEHARATAQYEKDLEAYEAALQMRPEQLVIEEGEDYVWVGGVRLGRRVRPV